VYPPPQPTKGLAKLSRGAPAAETFIWGEFLVAKTLL